MTKEKFEKYDKTQDVYCECCETKKPVSCFSYRNIKLNDRKANRCKVCDWFYRNHNGKIPFINGFTQYEIIETVSFILEKKGEYVNSLSEIINNSVDNTIDLIYKLNLKNVHILVKSKCECCGKEIGDFISVYLKNKNLYCSHDCYWKDKTNKTEHGENSPFYNRIETTCTNCKKSIKIPPHKYNSKNKYGDNHNFCSQECYWQYRSKYYISEKATMYNHTYTEEQKEHLRKCLLNRLKKSDRLETKIQLSVNNILDKNNIDYEREKVLGYYAVDNYLPDNNGIIEVMGDYWHSSPLRYNAENYINEIQQKQLHRDKLKYSYIKNHYDTNILYLWETDVNSNPELCEELIKLYISNNKVLENYHSFNWQLKDGVLSLKSSIIIPYQDMPVNDYRHLIKKKVG